ncbi:MAG: thrombospondin type 3 repeat-containing protein [Bradymonadaceae bacterium]|nr:thrombospondin type 3 repeat-containing protein [Lujinxingiaceae bacterium]
MRRHLAYLATILLTGLLVVPTAVAEEARAFECDGRFEDCGTPELSGGGGGGGGGSILIANTDKGTSYQFADDYDDDGVEDNFDNCPRVYNPDQADSDGDGVGDACDNCPNDANPDQANLDGDDKGDACDDDRDGDGVANAQDNCPDVYNPDQADLDGDGKGDACDPDINGNGTPNESDPCPMKLGGVAGDDTDECFPDSDNDGTPDVHDNCPYHYNPDQADLDGDGVGDECDPDVDGDGVVNALDNCPNVPNPDQADSDRDGVGDACDPDYCFVVLGDTGNCLDPAKTLAAYSPSMFGQTGEPVRLRMFANQQNQALRFEWLLVKQPAGSKASIENARGTVTVSTPFEYRYLVNTVPQIVPDLPGTYEVKLVIETIWEDRVSGTLNETQSFTAALTVEGDPVVKEESAGGCSVTPGQSTSGYGLLLLLGLVGLVRRKLRR